MKKKIKLRDMTEEQFVSWCHDNCPNDKNLNTRIDCNEAKCPFAHVICNEKDTANCWLYNKEDFSDKFLDQEVEVEVPDILTEEEKEYLEAVINPFKERIVGIGKALLCGNTEFIYFVTREIADEIICSELPPFDAGTAYKGMEAGKKYTLEELGL